MTSPILTLTRPIDQGAKGRNGWFTPQDITIWRTPTEHSERHHGLCIDVHSARSGKEAPIILYLSAEDAVTLGQILVEHGRDVLATMEAPVAKPGG